MGEFDGKVAIVTGAGRLRGIGRAAAVGFAKLGANVVVTGTGRDPSTFPPDEQAVNWRDIHSVADKIESHGVKALPLVADVTNKDDVQNMIDQAVKEFGRVDMLINNAAYARGPDRYLCWNSTTTSSRGSSTSRSAAPTCAPRRSWPNCRKKATAGR